MINKKPSRNMCVGKVATVVNKKASWNMCVGMIATMVNKKSNWNMCAAKLARWSIRYQVGICALERFAKMTKNHLKYYRTYVNAS